MNLPYRAYYNKGPLPDNPDRLRSVEVFLQLSVTDIFHLSHSPEHGFSQGVLVLVDSKTKIVEEGRLGTMRILNCRERRDVLRLFLSCEDRIGRRLERDEMAELAGMLNPVLHRYNNVIIPDGEYEMGFADLKDLSKRKLRVRRTGYDMGPYYDSDRLHAYESQLEQSLPQLEFLKARLSDAIANDRPDDLLRLSRQVAGLMRQVSAARNWVNGFREAERYIGGA